MKRRDFIKSAVALGVGGAADPAAAQSTPPADNAATSDITIDDLAVADRVEGRSYRESDHKLMLNSMKETRKLLGAIRDASLEMDVSPAMEFQPLLPGMRVPSGSTAVTPGRGKAPVYNGHPESLAFATAADLGRLLKARKITSVALTKMYLARLKRYGPRLNCVITLCEEHALKQAAAADAEMAAGRYRGPLHGIPYGAKDLLATRGIPTTYGAKPYINQMLDFDATVIKRLNEAGAVLAAKLSMGELAMGDVWFGGVTRSPWDSHVGSSGSSAGSASATAAGLVGFSIGTETLGSIVSPSTRCGVTGLRPTFGRVSRHGAMTVAWTMDKIGPICRGVEDCALVLHAIQGPDGQDHTVIDAPLSFNGGKSLSSLRIGIDHAAFEALKTGRYRSGGPQMRPNPDRQKIYETAVETLKSLGAELIPIEMPNIDAIREGIADLMISAESAAVFQKLNISGQLDLLAQQEEGSWPTTYRVGSTIPAADYLQALRHRRLLQQDMARALAHVDAYVTVPFMGPSLMVTNLTGHPTLVTRCGMLGNTPQSIEITGNLYREDAILRIAYAFEQATPWHTHWPDVDKLPETPPEMQRRG